MPACPSCHQELAFDTLAADQPAVCPHCGAALDLDADPTGLSSLAGTPADATQRLGDADDSGLAESSLASSGEFTEPATADSQEDITLVAASGLPDGSDPDGRDDATLAIGALGFDDEDDDFELEEDAIEDDEPEEEGPSESLDATIDLCTWAAEPQADFEVDDQATVDLGGLPRGDGLTQMADADASSSDSEATLQLDSDQPSSQGYPSSLEPSDSPSNGGSHDEATLVFDSEHRSSGVDTPEPLDITGLSGDTLPRGPLGEGRASASLRPGDSMIVGDESVRLRAFSLAEKPAVDDRGLDYAIEGEAGHGGMGVVYKARQQSLDRLVALKQIKSELNASESDRNKFVSEAVITGQLEHPNIAPVHDLGLAADGLPFYAMKFVEGEDWEDSIKEKTEEENLGILIQVAQAIAFAHSKNVLHRDLKPGNVRLGSFGEVLVMDWGLAARLDSGAEIQPAGTPIYMPPETALEYLDYAKKKVVGGKRVESSRRRAPAGKYGDIYLLGALLFKIVTGRAPHRGKSTFECLRNAAKNEITKTRRKSELLDIAYKAMATEPEDRHASAIEFIDALRSYQSHAQSILIARAASRELREADRLVRERRGDATQLYAHFSSAQNGYQNALELWDGNRKAQRRLRRTKRMFADAAYHNGDYDLACSLLDPNNDDDAPLRESVLRDQQSRRSRLAWFRRLQYATAASLLIALGFIAYSIVLKQDALSLASQLADTESLIAEKETQVAAKQREAAAASALAAKQTELANEKAKAVEQLEGVVAEKEQQAATATRLANQRLQEAETAKRTAAQATKRAIEQSMEATRQSYYAALGRVRATLADKGVYAAWKELNRVDPAIAEVGADDPEWGYLTRAVAWRDEATELVGEAAAGQTRPTRVATTPGGEWLLVASEEKPGAATLSLYAAGQAERPVRRVETTAPLGPVAIDPSGRYAAIAGPSLVVYDLQSGRLVKREGAESLEAACIAFHPTEPELLVGGHDTRVTRLRVDGSLRVLDQDGRWHQVGVTAVGYSPNGEQRFSTDPSGRVVVWRRTGGEWTDRATLKRRGAGSPRITAAAMADDPSGRLAFGCDDGAVYETFGWWDQADQRGGFTEAEAERLDDSHAGRVTSVAYAEAGRTILSSGGDTVLVRRSPTLATGGVGGAASRRVERRYHDTAVLGCVPVGGGLACSSDDHGRVVRWKLDATPPELVYQTDKSRRAGVASLSLASERGGLLVADEAGFVHHWNDLSRPDARQVGFVGHADHRDTRAWRLGGADPLIVTVAADNRAVVWGESDGVLRRSFDLAGRTIVALDRAKGWLLTASDGRPTTDGHSAVAYDLRRGGEHPLWETSPRVSSILPLPSDDPELGPRLAVGLTDGQVYLWSQDSGRQELVRSSARPHWRPVLAMAYDDATGRLFSGDRGGLVAAWSLGSDQPPIERLLEAGQSGIARIDKLLLDRERVLALQATTTGLGIVPLDHQLRPQAAGYAQLAGLLDLGVDPRGGLYALQATDRGHHLAHTDSGTGWRPLDSVSSKITGLRSDGDCLVLFGGGIAETRDAASVLARVVSRPASAAVVEHSSGRATTLDAAGGLETWGDSFALEAQVRLPLGGELIAAGATEPGGRYAIAIATAEGTTRLELWRGGRRLRAIAEGLPGRSLALAAERDRIALAFEDRIELFALGDGGETATVDLPERRPAPVGLALQEGGGQLLVWSEDGSPYLGRQSEFGGWRLEPIDRSDVTSAAFLSGSDRLALGVESGRVEIVSLEPLQDGKRPVRTLLSLPGHSDRVTRLRAVASADGATLVSGDASGQVVVRSL